MHPSIAELQERACGVLRNLSSSSLESRNLAGDAERRRKASAEAALKTHHATEKVVTEAQDLLQQLQL
jgi:hypothetical protein